MKRLASVLAVLIMLPCVFPALAEYAEVTGQVVNLSPGNVIADLGGTVSDILVSPGDSVRAGDVLAKLRGTKVYALQDGTAHFFELLRIVAKLNEG